MLKQVQAPKQTFKYSYVPAKVTSVKSNQVVTKVKDGITEVRDMFQKVDHAFKKRKEESQVLAMTVSDLENHLLYLETQTQDQIGSTSALGLALSSRQEQQEILRKDIDVFADDGARNFQRLFEEMRIIKEHASSVEKDMSQKLITLEECAEDQSTTVHCVQTQLSDILGQCEEEERVVADLAAAIEIKNSDLLRLDKDRKDGLEMRNRLDAAIAESLEELPLRKKQLDALKTSQSDKEKLSSDVQQKIIALTAELNHLDTTSKKHRLAFEAQDSLRAEELTSLAAEVTDKEKHRDTQYRELQQLQKQKDSLGKEVGSAQEALDVLLSTLQVEQSAQQSLHNEVERLQEGVEQMRCTLHDARNSAVQATKENEEQYLLTCSRMTSLREAHQKQATLTQAKHMAEEQLCTMIRDYNTAALSAEKDAAEEQRLLLMEQSEVDAMQELQTVSQQQLSTLVDRAAQLDEQHKSDVAEVRQLEEAKDTLLKKIAQQAILQSHLGELEHQRAAHMSQTEQAANSLRTQQEELATLEAELAALRDASNIHTRNSKKKQQDQDSAVSISVQAQEAHENEIAEAVALLESELSHKHVAEVLEIETCREQLAQGFPEQKEHAATQIRTKTAEVEGQRSALHAVNADIHKAQSDLMERECMQQQRLAALAAKEEALAAKEEAEAEAEAMTVAAATARANELANIVVHDSYRIDIDLVHSDDEQGPTSISNEIALQTTSTFTTQVFQTPALTNPVPYSNLSASLDTVNKTKVSKLEIEIMDQIPPSPPSGSLKQAHNTPNNSGLSRWELSQPAADHQLPPQPSQQLVQRQNKRNADTEAYQPHNNDGMALFEEAAPHHPVKRAAGPEASAGATLSSTESEKKARRREKNKIHKQQQKARNKARLQTQADDVTQHSDLSLDLLQPYPALSSAANAVRPPLHKAAPDRSVKIPMHTLSTSVVSSAATKAVRSSQSSTQVGGSSTASSWDIFGLPSQMPAPTKKYAGKSYIKPATAASAAPIITRPATPHVPAGLGDKRKFGSQPANKLPDEANAVRAPVPPPKRPAPLVSSTAKKSQGMAYGSEDWFDEEAPF